MGVRIHLVVEGQTEKRFADTVLAPELGTLGIGLDARCVYTSRDGFYWNRGGVTRYSRMKDDIEDWIKEERNNSDAHFSAMFDLYALPEDFPRYEVAQRAGDCYEKAAILEKAFAEDIASRVFVPYIQMHEFEALVLAKPGKLIEAFPEPEHAEAISGLTEAYEDANPEVIDDSNPPSKRIIQVIPEYRSRKASAGPQVVRSIGLETLTRRCHHFEAWVLALKDLAH